jgi:hypothetical protein
VPAISPTRGRPASCGNHSNHQQVLVRKANFADAYFLLAEIHQRQHDAPAVVMDLRAYLKLEPHRPESEQVRVMLERTQQAMKSGESMLAETLRP